MIKKFVGLIIISIAMISIVDNVLIRPNTVMANDNDKVLQAKNFILKFVSHPESVKFDDKSIEIRKDVVSIRFSYVNGIGVTETLTMNVKVD
jgi:hypothetical protein